MVECRFRQLQQHLQQPVDVGGGLQIVPAHHMAYLLQRVVDHYREMITAGRIFARQHHIAPALRPADLACDVARLTHFCVGQLAFKQIADKLNGAIHFQAQSKGLPLFLQSTDFRLGRVAVKTRINWHAIRIRHATRHVCRHIEFTPRRETGVEQIELFKPVQGVEEVGQMLRLAAHRLFPVQAKPLEILKNLRLPFWARPANVDILYAQQETPASAQRPLIVQPGGIGMAQMHEPGGAWGETEDGRRGHGNRRRWLRYVLPTYNMGLCRKGTVNGDIYMSTLQRLDGPRIAPHDGGKAKQLVVLLHGYGADGGDLTGIGRQWRQQLPNAAFVSPNAPEFCKNPPIGYQWFDLDPGLTGADQLFEGASTTAPVLNNFIDTELEALGLDGSALALVGFSQGTMMALHVALRRDPGPAAVIGYSGLLPGPDKLAADIKSKPEVLLVHGDNDPRIPVAALHQAKGALEAAGVNVRAHIAPGIGHGIDGEGTWTGGAFLKEVFGKAG